MYIMTFVKNMMFNYSFHGRCDIDILQQLIVACGALPELKRLLLMRDQPEIQCHTAGTFRNLAAEDQSQVILKSLLLCTLT